MADYLCRVRIDRAALDENKLLQGEGAIETERFYLKLSTERKNGYVMLQDFINYIYQGNNIDTIKVQALLDALKASNTLSSDTEVTETTDISLLGCACPLCTDIRTKNIKDIIYLTDNEELAKRIGSDHLLYVHDHIKVCSECQRYYCNGGEEVNNVTDDGITVYPETFLRHEEQFGHKPETKDGIKIPKLVSADDILGKSLLEKFNMYCLRLDEKPYSMDDYQNLHLYLKKYPTATNYLSYKYNIAEENGECVLRLKVEFSPCDYFLTRYYHSLELLELNVNEFLSYSVSELSTEDDLFEVGSLRFIDITGSIYDQFIFTLPQKNSAGEYLYLVKQSVDNITDAKLDFVVPSSHTKVTKVTIDDMEVNFKYLPLTVELKDDADTTVKIFTEEILSDEQEGTVEPISAVHIITFRPTELEGESATYNPAEESLTIPSLIVDENGELYLPGLDIEF